MPERYQSLIILIQERRTDGSLFTPESGFRGYLLLPERLLRTYPKINKIFSEFNLRVLKSNVQLSIPQNASLEAAEIFMGVEPNQVSVLAEENNKQFIISLLTSDPSENINLCFVPKFEKEHLSGLHGLGANNIRTLENLRWWYNPILKFRYPESGPLLHWAVSEKSVKIVQLLLKCGANVNSDRHADGLTPLLLAVQCRSIEVTRCLLQNGADTEVCGNIKLIVAENGVNELKGATPLILAIHNYKNKAGRLIQLLVDCGANVDAQCEDGLNCLQLAVRTGRLEVVKTVLGGRPDVNNEMNRNTLLDAVLDTSKDSRNDMVGALYGYGFRIKSEDDHIKLLYAAVLTSCTQLVRDLLKFVDLKGVDESGQSISAWVLENAALDIYDRYAYGDILKLLVEFGLDVNARVSPYESPVKCILCRRQSIDILKLFIEKGLIVFDNEGARDFVLWGSRSSDPLEQMDILLSHGADVNVSGGEASIVIVTCTRLGMAPTVLKTLLKYGAQIKSEENELSRPLFIAMVLNRSDLFLILLDYCFPDYELYQYIRNFLQSSSYFSNLQGGEQMTLDHIDKYECAYTGNLNNSSDDVARSDFRNNCLAEIERLKRESVGGSSYSFHDFLVGNANSISRYARNEDLVQFVLSEDYKNKFPIYGDVINWQFRRAYYRRKLLDRGSKVLLLLAKSLTILPLEIIEEIVDCLTNREILLLISDRSVVSDPIM